MENLWTPLFSLTVFLIVFAVGDVVSYKTKGLISGIIIAAVVYIAGYWTGIIPTDSVVHRDADHADSIYDSAAAGQPRYIDQYFPVALGMEDSGHRSNRSRWSGTDLLYSEQHAVHKRVRS